MRFGRQRLTAPRFLLQLLLLKLRQSLGRKPLLFLLPWRPGPRAGAQP